MVYTVRLFKRGRGRPIDDPLALDADQKTATEPAVDAYILAAMYASLIKEKRYAEAKRKLEKLQRLAQRPRKHDDDLM